MDWIFEKVFELVKDILKGDFSNLDKLPALIAVIVVFGCFLARNQVWSNVQAFRRRIRDFAKIKKFKSEVEEKQRQIKEVAVDIEEKIRDINDQTLLFQRKRSETLEQLKVLESKLPENSELYSLKRNVNELSETHELSVETIKKIKELLEQIIDVSRAEELRTRPDARANELLRKALAKQAARHSQDK